MRERAKGALDLVESPRWVLFVPLRLPSLYPEGDAKERPVMTDATTAWLPSGLSAELTKSLISLWTRYAGKPPTSARTAIRGNVVTCVLVDAVADYNRSMVAPQTRDTVEGVGKRTSAGYKREVVAAVVRLTRQRVVSFISSHDRDTDVATEVFTLEPSLSRGASRTDRRFRDASWLPPPRARAGA